MIRKLLLLTAFAATTATMNAQIADASFGNSTDGISYHQAGNILTITAWGNIGDLDWTKVVSNINAESSIKKIEFKTSGNNGMATITYKTTQAFMGLTKVTTLDYSNVQIDELCSAVDANWSKQAQGTFTFANTWDKNKTLTKLVLPHIKNANSLGHRHVPSYMITFMTALTDISTPDNATCIEPYAFQTGSGGSHITSITLNEGLKVIGNHAFTEQTPTSIVIPESMEYIGKSVFDTGSLHDVYFAGKKAPIVEAEAFGSKAYVNNNSVEKPTAATEFRVDRSSYINQSYMATMMHLRNDLTAAERALFTDITRDYHVFGGTYEGITVNSSNSDIEFMYNGGWAIGCDGTQNQSYIDAAEGAFPLKNNANIIWAGIEGDENTYLQNSSYYDITVGEDYRWPSQTAMCRAYSVASQNLLWDGTTKIQRAATSYDINCDGDTDDKGETFAEGVASIGLHEIILVSNDVNPGTNTETWEFEFGGVNWWTICVPVSMTAKQVRETFGDDTQVCRFSQVTRDVTDKIHFYFCDEQCYGKADDVIAIQANHPYMIRPSKYADGTTNFTLPDYEIDPTQVEVGESLYAVTANGSSEYAVDSDDTYYKYTFIGQYNTQADGTKLKMPQYTYYLGADPDNTLYHRLYFQTAENSGSWKPFTCIVIPEKGEQDYNDFFAENRPAKKKMTNDAKGVASSKFGLDDDIQGESNGANATAIENLDYEIICGADNAPVYNLNGQVVNSKNLTKGIYVKNGRTFLVK